MANRKIFLSFLGTNPYEPVIYTLNGKRCSEQPTVFVQEALVRRLCKNWTRNDAVMVFRTEKSERLNWLDRPAEGDDTACPSVRHGLQHTLSSLNYPMMTNPPGLHNDNYIIPPGFDETDIWQIFDTVADKILPGDEIYFDVTHAFRTIPMFATILFNYCRFIKHSTVKGIYYGAFEKLGSLTEVRRIPPHDRRVSIIDMSSIANMQSINQAAANFRTYGTVGTLGLQVEDTGLADVDEAIALMRRALSDFDFGLQTCSLDLLYYGDYMADLADSLETLGESPLNTAQMDLLRSIFERLTDFGFSEHQGYHNVDAAVEWMIEHGMIQQALTLAREYVPTRLAEHCTASTRNDDIEQTTQLVADALITGRRPAESGRVRQLMDRPAWIALRRAFNDLRTMRNKLNHAADNGMQSINDFIETVSPIWKSLSNALSDITATL